MEKSPDRRPARTRDAPAPAPRRLTIESLEERIAPSATPAKKVPNPPPYAPGTLYGLVRRGNLR